MRITKELVEEIAKMRNRISQIHKSDCRVPEKQKPTLNEAIYLLTRVEVKLSTIVSSDKMSKI
jgi:hypothetical protein